MVVIPIDSRRFQQRGNLNFCVFLFLPAPVLIQFLFCYTIDISVKKEPYCSLLPHLIHTGFTSDVQEMTAQKPSELAGVFLKREKLVKENVKFGKYLVLYFITACPEVNASVTRFLRSFCFF